MVDKAKYLLSSSLQKKFSDPCFKPLSFGVVYYVAIEKWLLFSKRDLLSKDLFSKMECASFLFLNIFIKI